MKDTLCWFCTKPGTGRCSWDRSLTPVIGWTAEPSTTDGFDTFRVIKCPLYTPEPFSKLAALLIGTANTISDLTFKREADE